MLEQVQRRAARFVTKTYSREESCVSQALNSLQWQTLQQRRRIARLCMLYKTLNNEAGITIPTYAQHQQLQRTRYSHPLKFIPLQATCDGYKFSFWPRTIRDWNSLHADIIQSTSIHCFKRALGSALMSE